MELKQSVVGETTRSRLRKVMTGQRPSDRLPVIEWASWWKLTLERWRGEGLPAEMDPRAAMGHLGLDMHYQWWAPAMHPDTKPLFEKESHYQRWIRDEKDYDELLPQLYPDPIPFNEELWRQRAAEQQEGGAFIWLSLSGFFWWPRVLLGVEPHLLAFYDQPKLLHRINQDMTHYMGRCLDRMCAICTPDFMTFGEDMSYNHGPMLSKATFDEFLAPYYRQIVPKLKERGISILIDSDGDVEPLIPWLEEVGIEGILPLERMAGVDVNRIREKHPKWKMVGGFDKTVMHLGERAIRAEFERLMPAMRGGYYIPSVDHQTPPAVSLEQYRAYVKLLKEYATKAVAG